MSYILLWSITFVKITLGNEFEKFRRIKNFLSGKIEDFVTLFYMRENFQRQGTL
jgi:hypothetical protein